ncbi:YbcC family protein [Paracoccus alkanivorans]|uniref:Probable inorganic carbon transporter subunit DabA n=1 Tax=Paracoccus alkanivorans TaxID=2116655 RepID=A0A3M0M0T1_9RHOB|nr:DUF2309 domain-containing protein [Paracoccus alkanivorans]RMC29974.1 DUF2309 domain-containing protein [Paracoccus alkanivorans]
MKMEKFSAYTGEQLELIAAAEAAIRAIPPLWPLSSSVAVNPFLGQSDQNLAQVAARLGRVAGLAVTMPRGWFRAQIEAGDITDADLTGALAAALEAGKPDGLPALKSALARDRQKEAALPTVAELAAEVSGIDWPGLMAERIGAWASDYFDRGQALWQTNHGTTAFQSWRAFASRDLTPEIIGLAGFASHVAGGPENPRIALTLACNNLGVQIESAETYFHQLLLGLGGWSQFARYRLWQAELAGDMDATTSDLLTIRLVWEEALFAQYAPRIADRWVESRTAHAAPVVSSPDQIADAILQEAAERAAQRRLAETLATSAEANSEGEENRPALQAAFCIDVRSEVFRRALEATDSGIRTLGFAGFFAVFTKHRCFASDVEELRLPVLLNPSVTSSSGDHDSERDDLAARHTARARRAWGRFKLAAVSSFAFVEATGPIYIGKLVRDALGLNPMPMPNDPKPRFDPDLDLATRIESAETILRAMSLTRGFARVILLAGHGANVVNNPYASGLHCGACGGYSGEVNARLLAGLLNDADVRDGLASKGIRIPADTLFVGALHDTTTDRITLYADDHPCPDHTADLTRARGWLATAGAVTRTERALRLPRAERQGDIDMRSRDWAEVRPEWALAGCKAFIAAPRSRTTGKSLEGRAFLHDYDWMQDKGFGVLELIMTAPVVVASWISLQYYGSTVAPQLFGSGNKLLHNVTGGIGVVEGNGGLLRAGLPWQSVHDGLTNAHEPLRLSVCIEAPREAMGDILKRHAGVRALFDNRWLHLFALDETGRMAWRYAGDLDWTPEAEVVDKPRLKAVE